MTAATAPLLAGGIIGFVAGVAVTYARLAVRDYRKTVQILPTLRSLAVRRTWWAILVCLVAFAVVFAGR